MSSSAGTSFIATRNANGTGLQFFRFGIDFSGTTAQRTITIGSDVDITPSQTYNLNSGCTTSGSMRLNVSNTAHNYVFKTLNAGTNPTGTFVVFEVQGTVQTVSSVTQAPANNAVLPGSNVVITANLSGALSSGQNVYLRYTSNNYTNSTVVAMTGSGTTYTASIPAGTNTAGANVSYYVFTSGPTGVANDGSNADLYTINLNNNGGTNYNYTVLTPATIYQHNFGTAAINVHPYTVAPGVFATNLSNSSWANSNNAWTSFAGSAGQAIALNNSGGTPTITLTFDVASGFAVNVTSFNLWRRRSNDGAQNWSMTINGTAVGSGTVPDPGAAIGTTNVSNAVNGLTGTVTVVLSLSGASGTGTFRLDDFTLNGLVYPLPGPTAAVQSPVGTTIANGGSRASFGNIVVGTTADFPVRIRNLGGTNTLTVNSINFGGANGSDLSLVTPPAFPFNVAPGAFQDLTVRVAPGAVGARTATMTVASNDASGNASYVINLSATGTASAASDIIDNTTYSSSSPDFNINTQYINFVNNTQNSNDKPVVMKFIIRDGGAGAPDADNLPTSLTAISFTVRNLSAVDRSNFIETAVLTTEGGTVINPNPPTISGGEIQFTGLVHPSFTVADNGSSSSNLHLRVSFRAANVIDNEKLVYRVSSATCGATSSQFLDASAGAARTNELNTNDQNRIEVIATRFAFVQQPSATGFGQTMTPSPSVEAQDANSRRDLDFTGAISLTSSGTMTGSPISVNAIAGLATFTPVIHTVQQTSRQLTASNGSLTAGLSSLFDINASSGTTDFFRTATGFTTGNWNATGSWESSPDNATWVAASVVPNSSASGITVRSGTLTISADASAKLLTVQSGAVLVHNNGAVFTIADDGTAATDFLVQGRYSLNGRQPVLNIGATAVIASGAEVWGVTNSAPGESDDFARNTAVTWQNNSVFSWNTVNAFETSGTTYFSGTPAAVIPIFRIQANTSVGAGSATTINGVVEMAATYTSTWNAAGAKEFRNGIIGSGTLTQAADCGQFRINGTTSQLGSGSGTLTLNLRNDLNSGLALQAGTCTLLGNVTSNSGPMYVDAGATLNAGTNSISGSSSFTLNANATLVSANAAGVNGSIAISGTPNFNNGSNYVFNGTMNQVTGTRMADVVGSLSINNSGTSSNNFVTLTDNNTTATTFNLQAGIFRAGSANTLRIAAGGTVNGSGGHVSTDVNGEGGTIQMLGAGNITGTPRLLIVAIGNSGTGVSFTNNAPIYHQCIIGSNGFVTNAPTYQSGSTLIYRTGGPFNRNVEWGNTAGLPGYPHHVTVDGNTIVDLFSNIITPSTLAIGGNLQLGSSNGYGRMYLNNNMNKPLEVLGDVTIGNGDLAANTSVLALEDSQPGGDLILHGNFTRHSGSVFTGYNRAVFLRGSNNSSIRVLPQPPASSGTTIDEIFPYVFVQKSNPDAEITMNCTVGVNDQLDLTGNGLITSTTGNYLVIINKNSNAIIGGSANSFVNGPLIRRTANTADNYHYPVGKKTGAGRVYRPLRFSTMNNLGNGDEFTGEYFKFAGATPSAGDDVLFGSTIGGILKNEYWQFDRIPSSIATGKLAITYQFPGSTNEWRDAAGGDSPPCADCNVAVVKRSTNSGGGNWNFTKTDNNFDDLSTDYPEARYHTQSGFIQSGELTSFSPFTIGFNFNTILGTLPVKLLAFNGSMQQQKANLQWQIDSDKDVQHFELQHSTNGTAFTAVHTLLPAGNTYSSTHLVSMPGRHFYRLKVKEKNGRSFYSKVVVLVAGNSATFISGMQSTVVSQQAVVNVWSQQNQSVQTSLYDAAGKLIAQQQQQLLRGDNQLKVSISQLPQGTYFLQVQTADGVRQTLRWLKQ
ncbi:choice-of-anchor D domain-containing protein [Phnomibacter sp. MR]|uniref:choice-of-anchor D domain-containing protein n=1 Tax=Phnomibacter sp. MR TaxID=3042318 RepID=UPI003A80C073